MIWMMLQIAMAPTTPKEVTMLKFSRDFPPKDPGEYVHLEQMYRAMLQRLTRAGRKLEIEHQLVPVKFRFAVPKKVQKGPTPAWLTMSPSELERRGLVPSAFGGRTVCRIYDGNGALIAAGVARCSMKDRFDPLIGAYVALTRATVDHDGHVPPLRSSLPGIDKMVYLAQSGQFHELRELLGSVVDAFGVGEVYTALASRLDGSQMDRVFNGVLPSHLVAIVDNSEAS